MPAPLTPRYISPKERAEDRARWQRFAYGTALTIAVAITVMMLGYRDQAHPWMRSATVTVDGFLGFPVLQLMRWAAGS